jgi:hypothetical protein
VDRYHFIQDLKVRIDLFQDARAGAKRDNPFLIAETAKLGAFEKKINLALNFFVIHGSPCSRSCAKASSDIDSAAHADTKNGSTAARFPFERSRRIHRSGG